MVTITDNTKKKVNSSVRRSLKIKDLDSEPKVRKKTSTKKPVKLATKPKTKPVKKTSKAKKKVAKKTVKKAVKKSTRKTTKTVTKKTTKKVDKKISKQKPGTPTKLTYPPKYVLRRDPVKKAAKEPTPPKYPKSQPLGHLLVEKLLREAGFAGGISTNNDILDRYSTDESIFSVRPQIVLQPKNQRDIEIAVKILGEQTHKFPALSLTPRAAGTGLSGGSLTDSIVIDVCRYMNHIEEPVKVKNNVSITVEPGAMWKDVEKVLKKQHVYLPPYPASKDICSIGGSIANNAAGPDSLLYGHCADWVESLNVTLYDGVTYTLKPITYKEYKALIKKDNALGRILEDVFTLIEKHEKTIDHAKPKTKKNSAGYALWDVIDGSVASFKRGKTTLDLTRLISGSQGTIGVITSITLKTEPICDDKELIVVPVFDMMDAGNIITTALDFDPINIEIFDALSFDLALKNPTFFKDRLATSEYYRVLLSMYTLYHVRYLRKIPDFTLLITIDKKRLGSRKIASIVDNLKNNHGKRARVITSAVEKEMFWQIRRASYSLSKFQDPSKRPAAFLEDMTVPPENISKFLAKITRLLKKYNVTAAMHGHGGNGHFHFYPLLDFTKKGTGDLVEKMSEEFFTCACDLDGDICGEHNDGIIRTPHLDKMFNKTTLQLFKDVERIFDPADIFNPGKKVNPKFDIKETLRKTN